MIGDRRATPPAAAGPVTLDRMTISRPPAGLEFKAPALLTPPPGTRAHRAQPETGVTAVDPDTGVIEAIVAVTGVVDDVADEIVPGAFRRSLRVRQPAMCLGHDWNRVVGKPISAEELMPGSPRLPRRTPDGQPWPPEAGALLVKARFNLATADGRDAYANAKFFGADQSFSIGYKVARTRRRGGVRLIDDLDLYEFSPVLHGANRLARQQSIKSGRPAGLEVKRTPVVASVPTTVRRRWALSCSTCGQPTALADAPLRPNARLICRSCVDAVGAMADPFGDPTEQTTEQDYADALRNEARVHAAPDGTLRTGPRDIRRP